MQQCEEASRNERRGAGSTSLPPASTPGTHLLRMPVRVLRYGIQLFVVLTHGTAGLRELYGLCTRLVLRYVVGVLGGHPAVRSVYLRRSGSSREHIFGLSDSDIGVIIDAEANAVLDIKESVYRRYRRFIAALPRGLLDANLSIYTTEEIRDLLDHVDVRGLIDAHLAYRVLEMVQKQ